MKILVTGGAGFIGSHVVDAYLRLGHEVVVIDNLSTGRKSNLNPSARFIQADICDLQLAELFTAERFDLVNHHAAQMDVRLSVADPIFDAQTNIIGTLNILQNCIRTGVKKVIFASSGGVVYGEQDYFPADENHPQRPYCPYGVAKLTGEKYLFFYRLTYGLQYTAFRYANVYGPRQNPHGEAGVVAIFLQKLLRGEQPIINGDGGQTRDFVYIDDVVAANIAALTDADGEILNIGTGIETSVNELYDLLMRLCDSKIAAKYGPAKAGEQRRSVLDVRRAAEVLGWRPRVSLEEGLARTIEFFRHFESRG
ncbi:MAG: SDR family oxidoreductase [candidate division KSB1 bacterium]|nr:SDR family oxidoreductase [candidate division KSB1 bacterium]MDZ7346756.1 SDR family oxidoreductase [candidate division KSB1 bacterium]